MSEYEVPPDEPQPLTPAQRRAQALTALIDGVDNGGFHAYLESAAADEVDEALAVADAETAAAVREALAVLKCPDPTSRTARERALDKLDFEAFDDVDARFWALDRG